MTRLIFWDVDTQYDFMKADGKLYVPGSEEIIPTLKALTDYAHAHHIPIIASADDHVPGHRELSDTPDFVETFPPHCMRGTPGQQKIAETQLVKPLVIEPELQDPGALAQEVVAHSGDILFHKHWFDVFTNQNVIAVLRALEPENIVLYGVALDVCDRYAIEGLLQHRPRAQLWFVTDAARAIREDQVEPLLRAWRERGVRMVTAADILDGGVLEPLLPGRGSGERRQAM